jgi:hypothetical protein
MRKLYKGVAGVFGYKYGEETMRNVDLLLVDFIRAVYNGNPDEIVRTNMLFIKELSKTQSLPNIQAKFDYSPNGLKIEILFHALNVLACPVCKTELVESHNQICEACCQRLNSGT